MADVFVEIRQVVLTSLLSLVVMFVFTRIGGKRQIAQMSPFDYLNAVTVGSIGAELATDLEQWWRPLSALIIYILATWLVHYTACKSNAMRSFWSGRSLLGLLVLAGYVLLVEDNQWLRLSAVKAVAVYLFFTFVIQAVGYVPDVLGIISDAGNLFNAYVSVPVLNDIVTLVKDLIYLAEKIFLMVLGVKALNQGTVAVPFVDKLVVKYL